MGVSENSVPLNPMVLLIIIPIKIIKWLLTMGIYPIFRYHICISITPMLFPSRGEWIHSCRWWGTAAVRLGPCSTSQWIAPNSLRLDVTGFIGSDPYLIITCTVYNIHMGMDQYLLIPFLGGWTSIYQLFWCSPGVQGFDTLPYLNSWED